MTVKRFYDIHCHALNLSHPSLLPFIKRLNLHTYFALNAIPGVGFIVSSLFNSKINTIMNLLAVMEIDMGSYFLEMEKELKPLLNKKKQLPIGNEVYDKVVLTPLMMDFGQKQIDQYQGIHFGNLPQRTIVEQVIDLFNGIKNYKNKSRLKLLEIYPFLGLNTQNYEMKKTKKHQSLRQLLNKYFGEFTANSIQKRPAKLLKKMGTFTGNMNSLKDYSFAGIKVYPPLGFDPWPDSTKEKEKVEYLYSFCARKQIPITTHCSKGGFIVSDKAKQFTSPKKWLQVLEYNKGKYKDLRLNFAHFGHQGIKIFGSKWQETVLDLITQFPNVYADFSYRGVDIKYYKKLRRLIDERPDIENKILFGSDFMVNLLHIDSYTAYIKKFQGTKKDFKNNYITPKQKTLFCSTNPERFLFEI